VDPIDELGLVLGIQVNPIVTSAADSPSTQPAVFDSASSVILANPGIAVMKQIFDFTAGSGRKPVTLERGFALGSSMPSRGVSHTTYRRQRTFFSVTILTRIRLNSAPSILKSVILIIGWGLTGARRHSMGIRTANQPLYSSFFLYARRGAPFATFDRGTLELKTMWKAGAGPQPHTIGFRNLASVRINLHGAARPSARSCRTASRIVDLVAICIDGVASIDKLVVSRDDIRETMPRR